jgi:uncharacterized protein
MSSLTAQREPYADILRVIAVFGVFVVNGLGYLVAPAYPVPMGAPVPPDSYFSLGVYGVLFFLFQGKAWPLLCFLFGYSLQSIASQLGKSGLPLRKAMRSRYRKLLVIGILHGVLIYFGDVLTVYALCGLIVIRWATSVGHQRLKASRLMRIWTWWLGISVLTIFFIAWLSFVITPQDSLPAASFAKVSHWNDFFALTAQHYLYVAIASATIFLPVYVWLVISGMLAYRLRLLSLRSFSHEFWSKRFGILQWLLSSMLCAFWAIYAMIAMESDQNLGQLSVIAMLSVPSGIWWLACCVAAYMRQVRRGLPPVLIWLAPAARYTLTMYLGLSLFLMVGVSPVFGGGLAFLFNNTPVAAITLFSAWVLAVSIAKVAARHNFKDPLSKWLSSSHRVLSRNS